MGLQIQGFTRQEKKSEFMLLSQVLEVRKWQEWEDH